MPAKADAAPKPSPFAGLMKKKEKAPAEPKAPKAPKNAAPDGAAPKKAGFSLPFGKKKAADPAPPAGAPPAAAPAQPAPPADAAPAKKGPFGLSFGSKAPKGEKPAKPGKEPKAPKQPAAPGDKKKPSPIVLAGLGLVVLIPVVLFVILPMVSGPGESEGDAPQAMESLAKVKKAVKDLETELAKAGKDETKKKEIEKKIKKAVLSEHGQLAQKVEAGELEQKVVDDFDRLSAGIGKAPAVAPPPGAPPPNPAAKAPPTPAPAPVKPVDKPKPVAKTPPLPKPTQAEAPVAPPPGLPVPPGASDSAKAPPSDYQFYLEAIKDKNLIAVQNLVNDGKNINAKDAAGRTPLYLSLLFDISPISAYLIDKGAQVNMKVDPMGTPLHLAVENHDLFLVKKLARKGAKLDVKNQEGYTPLMLAIIEDQDDISFALRGFGAKDMDMPVAANATTASASQKTQ